MTIIKGNKSLSTTSVFLIILSLIIGSLFFLRLGFSVGMLGFAGTILIIVTAGLIVVPASFALLEMATNQKIEVESQYHIISRTFGLSLGSAIGIVLYLLQTISIALYLIAFTEAFSPLLSYISLEAVWARPLISVPAYFLIVFFTHRKDHTFQVKHLLIVILALIMSLALFLIGDSEAEELFGSEIFSIQTGNISESFITVFNIIFPAFACVIAGIGFARTGKNSRSKIPKVTLIAIFIGFLIFSISSFKLEKGAISSDLVNDQLVMARITLYGAYVIPIVIAITSLFAASVFIKLAPQTLAGLASDDSIPLRGLNKSITSIKGKNQGIINKYSITYFIAFFFILKGELDYTAEFLSILYLLFFGSVCLCSFLNNFGADPSYRPTYRTRWYISLIGFIIATIFLFISYPFYAFLAIVIMLTVYFIVRPVHGNIRDFSKLIQSALFQLYRHIQIYFQKNRSDELILRWNPSVVCVTPVTFESDKALRLMKWISYRFGYGSYVHLIEGNLKNIGSENTKEITEEIKRLAGSHSRVYLSTLIAPSYHSALSQIIQVPVVPGKDNNLVLIVYDKNVTDAFQKITDGISLADAAGKDSCILMPSGRHISYFNGIHIWLDSSNVKNTELMLDLSYIIMSHPDWKDGKIRVFYTVARGQIESEKKKLIELGINGGISFSTHNIEIIEKEEEIDFFSMVAERSKDAGLLMLSFTDSLLLLSKRNPELFRDFGDILFIKASEMKEII